MAQFVTDNAVTGQGGAIVDLIDSKVGIVDRKVKGIRTSFWAIASAFIAIGLLAPAVVIPVGWIEINKVNEERHALEDTQRKQIEALAATARERAEISRLLAEAKATTQSARARSTVGR
jgi:hypothetical protein